MSTLTKAEEDWFKNACGAIADTAKDDYAKTYSLLSKRLTAAENHDANGLLKKQVAAAKTLVTKEDFVGALEAIEAAGEIATDLISKAPKKGVVSDLKSGDVKPLKTKEKGDKYIDEQFQKDELGQVKRGGEFRKDSKVRTHYATDEQKEDSGTRINAEGKLVDGDGGTLHGKMGYVVDGETGAPHTFKDGVNDAEAKEGYTMYNHHTTPLQGKKAAAAGVQEVDDGVVRKITSESGHYRPEPELTHQYVEGLKEQGVQMREKKLMMFNDKGEAVPLDGETERDLETLKWYEEAREKMGDTGPYQPRYQEMKDRLQAKGVAPSERDATVEVFDKRSMISEEEWESVKGDEKKVVAYIESKLGKKLDQMKEKFTIKPDDLVDCNDVLGKYLRMGEGGENAGRVSMKAEQFAQTGGNMDAIEAKRTVNAELLTKQINKLGGDAKLQQMGVADPSKLPLAKKLAILEGRDEVPKPEAAKKKRSFMGDTLPVVEAKDSSQPTPRDTPKSKPLAPEDGGSESEDEEKDKKASKGKKEPKLESKPLTDEDKAKGYFEKGEDESEDDEKSPKAPPKPELKSKPLTDEDKAKGYFEKGEDESEDDEKAPKAPKQPELKSKPLTDEDKAKGYFEKGEDESEDDEKSPKAPPKPELKSKPLTDEDKAKGYFEKGEDESEDDEKAPKAPPKPELKSKPLTDEDKAKGYFEKGEDESEDDDKPPKAPQQPEPKAKGPTKKDEDEGKEDDIEPIEPKPQAKNPSEEKPKVQRPPKPKAMNIGEVKKSTSAQVHPLQGDYDEKGGDEALLAKQLDAWKKQNAKLLGALRDLDKKRKEAMAAFEETRSVDDKAKLDAVTKEVAAFKKDMDAKAPLPTRARLAKQPLEERLKELS